MIRATVVKLRWRPINHPRSSEIAQRLEAVLRSWEGTPYKLYWQTKGVGVDCVRFVVGVLDELRGTSTSLERVPDDVAIHQPELARQATRRLLERLRPWTPVEGNVIEPGDVLVCGSRDMGPGHAVIAGVGQSHLWHVDGRRVVRAGLSLFHLGAGLLNLHRIYRPLEKGSW